jgi:flagellar hook-basal body complex protein FliE
VIVNGATTTPATPGLSAAAPTSAGGEGGFARVIDQLLDRMATPQREADQALHNLAVGKTDNLHQVLLAVSKADLAFRLVLEIRNKLTEAYQEIQRMQV